MKKISKIIIFLSIALLICSGFLLSGCVNRGNRIISYPTNLIRGVAIITQGGEHIFLDEVAYSTIAGLATASSRTIINRGEISQEVHIASGENIMVIFYFEDNSANIRRGSRESFNVSTSGIISVRRTHFMADDTFHAFEFQPIIDEISRLLSI